MTTRDFIAKTYAIPSNKERHCSSVFTDYSGTVYSYGYHYPLAFKLAGFNFINTAGYSNTTAKHISWAWSAVGYDAISVKLYRDDARVIASSYEPLSTKLKTIWSALDREIQELTQLRDSKKRKDTAVYRRIESELQQAITNYAKATGVI